MGQDWQQCRSKFLEGLQKRDGQPPFADERHNAANHESNGQSNLRQVLNANEPVPFVAAIDLSGQSNAAAIAEDRNGNDEPLGNELLEPAVVFAEVPNEVPAGSTLLQSSAAIEDQNGEDDGNASLEPAVVIAQVSNEVPAGSTLLQSSAAIHEDWKREHGNRLLQHTPAIDLRRPSNTNRLCQRALGIAQDLSSGRDGHWSPETASVFNTALNPARVDSDVAGAMIEIFRGFMLHYMMNSMPSLTAGVFPEPNAGNFLQLKPELAPSTSKASYEAGRSSFQPEQAPSTSKAMYEAGRSSFQPEQAPSTSKAMYEARRSSFQPEQAPSTSKAMYEAGRSSFQPEQAPSTSKAMYEAGRSSFEPEQAPSTSKAMFEAERSSSQAPSTSRVFFKAGSSLQLKRDQTPSSSRGFFKAGSSSMDNASSNSRALPQLRNVPKNDYSFLRGDSDSSDEEFMEEAPKAQLPLSRKRPATASASSQRLKQQLRDLNGEPIVISDDDQHDEDDPAPVKARQRANAPQASKQSAAPVHQQEENSFECSICRIVNIDSYLRCGHVFCKDCLENLKKRKKALCPNCREPFRIIKPLFKP